MQCIIFMEANRRDSLWIFYSVEFYQKFAVMSLHVE